MMGLIGWFWNAPAPGVLAQGLVALVAAVWLALVIDAWIGEPPPRWHPVVWMGRYLTHAGAWLQAQVRRPVPGAGGGAEAVPHDGPSLWRGSLAWWAGALLVLACAGLLQWGLAQLPWAWGAVLVGVLLKPLLACRMLTDEVGAVDAALARSLPEGRAQLARIVSRDVQELDAAAVRESAIESLSENLNDSVVAPLFWFLVAGLPGAALWRYADTADSMWGYRGVYRGQVWEWAGKWAARIDDVLAWVPARLTALVWVLSVPACWHRALGALVREAGRTPSPNSGWPMAAAALVLDVHLRKPGVYILHPQGRAPLPGDIAVAVRLARHVVYGGTAVLSVMALLTALACQWGARA